MVVDTESGRRRALVILVLMAVLVSSGLIYRASTAAFTATTSNTGNSWTAGSVTLADDDSNAAMFNATGLTPSSTGQKCIVVSYTGNVASTVSLYGTATGALAPYINLTIQTGTGSTFAAGTPCTGFVSSATIYTGTLSNFAATSTNFASGMPTAATRWAPASAGTRVYRFAYTVADNNAAQGQTASATFTWEAQST